jgi:hypothetical protein
MGALEQAKINLLIPDLWQKRNWRANPGRSCRVPWREDRAPSGSVLADGRLFHDFTSGETLDAPGLLARVESLTPETACRLFIQLAGAGAGDAAQKSCAPIPARSEDRETRPELPTLDNLSPNELRQLGELRCLSVKACAAASERGHLFSTDWRGARCWLVTDWARRSAQLRRFDGRPFTTRTGATIKALTVRGSSASWPIGAPDAGDAPRLILCEGGGDFLAAYHFAEVEETLAEVQPVALLGASQRIHAAGIRLLAGKRIRIFPHLDGAGAGAALRWELQLREAGLDVHCFDLAGLTRDDGAPVKDLNDLTRIAPDDFEQNRELWSLTIF